MLKQRWKAVDVLVFVAVLLWAAGCFVLLSLYGKGVLGRTPDYLPLVLMGISMAGVVTLGILFFVYGKLNKYVILLSCVLLVLSCILDFKSFMEILYAT